MRDGGRLRGLTLAGAERSPELVAAIAAEHVERVPDLRSADLVGHVLEHPDDLAATDLIEELPTELRVVPLLVDGERAVADDRDPSVGRGDDVLERQVLVARK